MGAPDLFIALVTHAQSSYLEARSPAGAAAQIARVCDAKGLTAEVVIEDRDLWTESGAGVSSAGRLSYRQELIEEWRWRGFLGTRTLPWTAQHALRFGKSLMRLRRGNENGNRQRLLNIEMAHRSLWEQGLQSGAEIILVIEDDASIQDPDDFITGLLGLLVEPWSYLNLSLSFDRGALGVADLLNASELPWAGSVSRDVLRARRPVTNTVCALAYRRAFLARLVSHWDAMPMEPVLPIDWKMNRALREMVQSGALEPDSTLWVEPGPLVQRSLHPSDRS